MSPSKKSNAAPPRPDSFAQHPDHHLVTNRGFWWVCCSINATSRTKEKLSYSLRTKCLNTARLRRDIFLAGLHAEGLEVRLRRHSAVALGAVVVLPPHRLAVPWQHRVETVLKSALAAELPENGAAVRKSTPTPRRKPMAALA